jgi:hypothetical protein
MLLTKEMLDSTRKEVSVLKALGYRNFTTTSLVMDGQGIVMLISFFMAIPIALVSLN